ncbi:hypothetical protein Peur_045357 [Populus x canadensis]
MELGSGLVFVCPHPPLKMRTPFGLDCFVLLSRVYHRKTKKEGNGRQRSRAFCPLKTTSSTLFTTEKKMGFYKHS